MAVDTAARSNTWTFVDGEWLEGNPKLIGPTSHAMWLGSTVFDGGRWFDGISPDLDLHCQRVNRSALALDLKPTIAADEMQALALEGVRRFDGKTAIYIKPMYWGEHGAPGLVPVDPESTRFALCLFEAPMAARAGGISLTLSPFRRPTNECMPTGAKAGCLYPNNARILREAHARGFDNALVRDMLGHVAETGSSNVFMVKDGVVFTPAANRTFLAGITRARIIGLLKSAGFEVVEASLTPADFDTADEIFTTGNYAKVASVTRLEARDLPEGPVAAKARSLYMEWARDTSDF
ncbi:branched chain amino acid aminotransferase [Xaviernesmea oryzae]|uniref:Probable branched-chain-amino-acid aminotransferase n=1 Tax=Xaviernesmea oryzae TaxID=464029 RepID=A0A1Q9B0Q8_9HYPH|nr:branched-chain amino acid aminotransferase [Xaviernesmea oryzae]OLP61571.1 branched chain amino acid aminotransferase [Xaviernesmea oryzae]SEL07982.1 branched-chain amino acid aminotransferase [Xaviernesmea oryzae]